MVTPSFTQNMQLLVNNGSSESPLAPQLSRSFRPLLRAKHRSFLRAVREGNFSTNLLFAVGLRHVQNSTLAGTLRYEVHLLLGKRGTKSNFLVRKLKCCEFPHERLVTPTSLLAEVLENKRQNTRHGPSWRLGVGRLGQTPMSFL